MREYLEILDYFARPLGCYVGLDEHLAQIEEGDEDPVASFWAYKHGSRRSFATASPERLKQLIDAERCLRVDLLRWKRLPLPEQMRLMRVLPINVWNFVRAELHG